MINVDNEVNEPTGSQQLADWEDLLRLDQSNVALAEAEARLDAARARLRIIARQMIDQARQSFPTAPVYLAPAPDRSNTFLRWRSRQSQNRGGRVEIDDPYVVAWLAGEAGPQRRLFLKFDRGRCLLNDQLATVVYALQRQQRQSDLRQKRMTVLRQLAQRTARQIAE